MEYSSNQNIDSSEFLLTNSQLSSESVAKILAGSTMPFSWDFRKANELLAEMNQFYKLSLPDTYNEYILEYNYAPLMWIADSPVNKSIFNFYRQNYPRINGTDAHKQIIDIYKKWILQDIESEKKYFASSLINLSERNIIKNNFLMMILSGVVFLYDNNFKNLERAKINFERTLDIIKSIKMKDDVQNEIQYLVKLNLAYLYLHQSDYLTAHEKFLEIIIERYYAINARYHLLYTDIQLNNFDNLGYLVTEILEYEKARFISCLSKNNSRQNLWLMKYSGLSKILTDSNLIPVHSHLKDLISEQFSKAFSAFETFSLSVKQFLSNVNQNEFNTEAIDSIKVLNEISEYQKKYNSPVIYFIVPELETKFKAAIQSVINNIRHHHKKTVEEKLLSYDSKINELALVADKSAEENKETINKLSEKLHANLKKIEDKLRDESLILEQHVERISEEMNQTPKTNFSNTMIYNTIISFMVFVMSGCVRYTNNYVSDVTQLSDLLLVSIVSGLKWGAIAFLVGVLVSLFNAGLAYIDKASKRQKLIQRIKDLKIEKDFVYDKLKKDFEYSKAKLTDDLNEELNLINEQIEKIKLEKADKRILLEKEAEEQIEKETAHLTDYLK